MLTKLNFKMFRLKNPHLLICSGIGPRNKTHQSTYGLSFAVEFVPVDVDLVFWPSLMEPSMFEGGVDGMVGVTGFAFHSWETSLQSTAPIRDSWSKNSSVGSSLINWQALVAWFQWNNWHLLEYWMHLALHSFKLLADSDGKFVPLSETPNRKQPVKQNVLNVFNKCNWSAKQTVRYNYI